MPPIQEVEIGKIIALAKSWRNPISTNKSAVVATPATWDGMRQKMTGRPLKSNHRQKLEILSKKITEKQKGLEVWLKWDSTCLARTKP
jgi:hypothetical protein